VQETFYLQMKVNLLYSPSKLSRLVTQRHLPALEQTDNRLLLSQTPLPFDMIRRVGVRTSPAINTNRHRKVSLQVKTLLKALRHCLDLSRRPATDLQSHIRLLRALHLVRQDMQSRYALTTRPATWSWSLAPLPVQRVCRKCCMWLQVAQGPHV
jgi:hypothetical protein